MVNATLERNGTSVDVELLANGAGTPLVSRDIGRPNLEIQETGSINPRHVDQWSGLEQYTISGKLTGSNAYSRAITLMDLIKSNSNGNKLSLNIGMSEYDTDINVVPAAGQDAACTVEYNPGWRNYLEVDLSLTRINQIVGSGDQPANTPTASGSGPIQLSYRGTTIDLVEDVTVTRSVGRPQSVVRRVPNADNPNYIDKFKTASDRFELSFEFTENAVSQVNDIVDLFSTKLARSSLTLDFQGLYGLGAFNVVPDGSGALRHTRVSGEEGTGLIPTVALRRVL